ncbi:MAG: hypothetical protein JRJ68_05680 [Deltaproteobacteria bacterium]|nr:hypothetical protein [Deltaproteobacteria bacterium]
MTFISTFTVVLAITFPLLLATALLINYCKRRQHRTSHGLTGMCHKSGGTMCSSCSSQLQLPKGKILSRPE